MMKTLPVGGEICTPTNAEKTKSFLFFTPLRITENNRMTRKIGIKSRVQSPTRLKAIEKQRKVLVAKLGALHQSISGNIKDLEKSDIYFVGDSADAAADSIQEGIVSQHVERQSGEAESIRGALKESEWARTAFASAAPAIFLWRDLMRCPMRFSAPHARMRWKSRAELIILTPILAGWRIRPKAKNCPWLTSTKPVCLRT